MSSKGEGRDGWALKDANSLLPIDDPSYPVLGKEELGSSSDERREGVMSKQDGADWDTRHHALKSRLIV